MIIRDRETGTLWQHATGEALAGPLGGARLELLGGEMMAWGAWKRAHPQTLAAQEPDEWTGILPKKRVTAVLERVTDNFTGPGLTPVDKRLPAHEPVAGISVGNVYRAYPLAALNEAGIIEEQVNGRQVRVAYDAAGDQVRASLDGAPLWVQRTWWAGWFEFHPQTTVYEPGLGIMEKPGGISKSRSE